MILAHKTKGRSLMPSPSLVWFGQLKHKWKLFNKSQRQINMPQMSLKSYCYSRGIDLSGKNKVKL